MAFQFDTNWLAIQGCALAFAAFAACVGRIGCEKPFLETLTSDGANGTLELSIFYISIVPSAWHHTKRIQGTAPDEFCP